MGLLPYCAQRVAIEILAFTPDWRLIGFLLILIGLIVDFEVRVISSEDQEGINSQEEAN